MSTPSPDDIASTALNRYEAGLDAIVAEDMPTEVAQRRADEHHAAVAASFRAAREAAEARAQADLAQAEGAWTLDGMADPATIRDARDRARAITTPRDALTLMRQAIADGDRTLQRAIAIKASGSIGWEAVVAMHRANSSDGQILDRLQAAQNNVGAQARFARQKRYATPTRPIVRAAPPKPKPYGASR